MVGHFFSRQQELRLKQDSTNYYENRRAKRLQCKLCPTLNSLGNRAERLRYSKLHPQWQVREKVKDALVNTFTHTWMYTRTREGTQERGKKRWSCHFGCSDVKCCGHLFITNNNQECCISFKHDAFSIVLILKVIFRIPSTTQKERKLVLVIVAKISPAHSIQFWISW